MNRFFYFFGSGAVAGKVALLIAVVLLLLPFEISSAATPHQTSVRNAVGQSEQTADYVPGRAIVGFEKQNKDDASRAVRAAGGRITSTHQPGRYFVVDIPSAVPGWVASLARSRGVRFAEPDYLLESEDVIPNDPQWGSLWGLGKIRASAAWDIERGSSGVVVGVIDTGVDYNHPDLAAQMWTNPGEIAGDLIDNDSNGWVDDVHGADCRNQDGAPLDDNGHGTHVAGTIAAVPDNNLGVAGINWESSVMALKFLSASGSGSTSDAIECIDYAIAKGADLTNNSWGGSEYSQALSDAIARAQQAGQLFVAAAGNNGSNNDHSPHYPSSYARDNIISVAATGTDDALASFSNHGEASVDIAAPGVAITSTLPGGLYGSKNGTSMATPHVTGAAALVMAAYPEASYDTVLDRLYGGSLEVPSLDGRIRFGRLDAAAALEGDPQAPGPTTLAIDESTRTSVSLRWVAPDEDGLDGLLGTSPAESYRLRYTPSGTDQWALASAPDPGSPGTLQQATLSGLRPDTAYDFDLQVTDNVGNVSSEQVTGSTKDGVEILYKDMESGAGGWTADSPWAITTERPQSPTRGWSDSPNGFYANSRDISIRSAAFSLVGTRAPRLSFWHRYALEKNLDFVYVYISADAGATWTQLAAYTGVGEPTAPEFDLSPYIGASDVRVRFRLRTNGSVRSDGYYLDDVIVSDLRPDSTPPDPPTGLTVTDHQLGRALSLEWLGGGEPDLQGYNVYRTTDPETETNRTWTKVNGSLVAQPRYEDTGVTDGTLYHYEVTALDTFGNESIPSLEASATPTDLSPPSIPDDLVVSALDGQVVLDWSDNPETDFDRYLVLRANEASGPWVEIGRPTTSSFTDSDVTNGTLYFYAVAAQDDSENQSESGPAEAAQPGRLLSAAYPPSAVSILKGSKQGDPITNLVANDGSVYRINSIREGTTHLTEWFGSATIQFLDPSRLTLEYDGRYSRAVMQEVLVFNFDTGVWQALDSRSVSTTDHLTTWSTLQPHAFVSPSGEVRMKVRSSQNRSHTARADLMRITIEYPEPPAPDVPSEDDSEAPVAPSGLTAIPDDSQVALDWNDGAESDLQDYLVYRTELAPGSAGRLWAHVATTTTSSYVDSGLTNGTTYYYRLTARDANGNESSPSEESATAPALAAPSPTPAALLFNVASTSVLSGSFVEEDPLTYLATNDGRYLRADSGLVGGINVVDWYGSASIGDPSSVTSITFEYDGSHSSSGVSQSLYAYDFAAGTWQELVSATVGSTDIPFRRTVDAPAPMMSGTGEVRLRVRATRSAEFRSKTDVMSFSVTR